MHVKKSKVRYVSLWKLFCAVHHTCTNTGWVFVNFLIHSDLRYYKRLGNGQEGILSGWFSKEIVFRNRRITIYLDQNKILRKNVERHILSLEYINIIKYSNIRVFENINNKHRIYEYWFVIRIFVPVMLVTKLKIV